MTDAGRPAADLTAGHQRAFRGDIQGLRAVAVLSVALDHARVPFLAGGYVGVDVFFVISGFLITQLLLREATETGGISLAGFYGRRARRILPAATVTLVVSALASTLMLGYVQAQSVIEDGLWATFFAANVRFGRQLTDYFSADVPPSPLQHFWSLSVEEQFYLVWPLVLAGLIGAMAWRRRKGAHRGPRTPRAVGVVLLAALCLSLTWSVVLTHRDATAAYFSTPARAWELAVGAGCAVLASSWARWDARVLRLVGWAGLTGIIVAMVRYGPDTRFPGYAALLPVVGAAFVLIGGSGAGSRGGPAELLAVAPLRRIGDWSYSFYLWHWPFLVIPAAYLGHTLSVGVALLLLGGALVVAYASYRWVEGPFRRPAAVWTLRPGRGMTLYPLAIGLVVVVSVFANHLVQQEVAAGASSPPLTVREYGSPGQTAAHGRLVALVRASVTAAREDAPIPGSLHPGLLQLRTSTADIGACDYDLNTHRLCPRANQRSNRVLVLLGDSHARAWIPASTGSPPGSDSPPTTWSGRAVRPPASFPTWATGWGSKTASPGANGHSAPSRRCRRTCCCSPATCRRE